MRSRVILFLLLLSLGLTSVSAAAPADSDAVFTRANQEFANGNYRAAIDSYESLLKAGQWNAALFYNLGNAYFRAGDEGRAILNYERALSLDPNLPEARANLQLVRDRARALELAPDWTESHLDFLTRDQFAWVAAVAFWLAAFIFCGLYFARRRAVVWVFALCSLGIIALGSAFAVYKLETGKSGPDLAIVTAPKVQARLATADNTGTVLVLPPGSEIQILSTRGSWSYAALPNDLKGWVPADCAERVRL